MSDVINELILRTRSQHPVTSIVVTHDMHTAQKVADRVVMLYPADPAGAGRAADHLRRPARRASTQSSDPRVTQFVRGEAGERLMEMRKMADLRMATNREMDAPARQLATRAAAADRSAVMDERVVKFRVGVMVLSTLFIAGILMLLFGDARSLVRGSYTHLHALYRCAGRDRRNAGAQERHPDRPRHQGAVCRPGRRDRRRPRSTAT